MAREPNALRQPPFLHGRLFQHLLFWAVVTGGLIWLIRLESRPTISGPNLILLLALLPLPVYIHAWLMDRCFRRPWIPVYFLLTTLLIAGFAVVFRALFEAWIRRHNGPVNFAILLFCFMALPAGLRFLKANLAQRIEERRRQNDRLKDRLETIRQGFNPRLILDHLDRLQRLSRTEIDAVPGAILRLADFLRCAMQATRRDRIPLAEEARDLGGRGCLAAPSVSARGGADNPMNNHIPWKEVRQRIALHLLWWLGCSLLVLLPAPGGVDEINRWGAFAFFLTIPLPVDLHFMLLDKLWWRRKAAYVFFTGLVLSGHALLIHHFTRRILGVESAFLTHLVDTLFVVGVVTLLRVIKDGLKRKLQLEEAETRQKEIELALLDSRIHPHFLFNTLNSVYALGLDRDPRLSRIIGRLRGLMVYTFETAGLDRVALSKEIDFVRSHLALERLRLPRGSHVSLRLEGEPGETRIAPMLFLPLVENTFKHGKRRNDGALVARFHLEIDPRGLRFQASNTADSDPASPRDGGLANLRRRLDLLYKNRYELNTRRQGGEFSCTLEIRW